MRQTKKTQKQKGGAFPPLPHEIIEFFATNNGPALQEAISNGSLDPNKEYTYTYKKDSGRVRSYDGTLLGFLFAFPLYSFHVYGNIGPLPTLSKEALTSLYHLAKGNGANNVGSYFRYKGDTFHSTLGLAMVLDETQFKIGAILSTILKDIQSQINWTKEITKIVFNDAISCLKETQQDDEVTILHIKRNWLPIFDRMTHTSSMKTILRNVKTVANTRRKKKNLLSEITYLPPIGEVGFPGGNEYRKAAERWQEKVLSV
jgi:hypothetical protein